jgi:hypothetical protein
MKMMMVVMVVVVMNLLTERPLSALSISYLQT